MEQNGRLATFHQSPTDPNCCTRASTTVGQAVLDSSAGCEMRLSLDVRQAQLNKESAVQQRERNIFLRLGNDAHEAQEALRQQTPVWCTSNINFFEGEAQTNFVRHHMESEQLSQECDLVQKAQHLSGNCQSPNKLDWSKGKTLKS